MSLSVKAFFFFFCNEMDPRWNRRLMVEKKYLFGRHAGGGRCVRDQRSTVETEEEAAPVREFWYFTKLENTHGSLFSHSLFEQTHR